MPGQGSRNITVADLKPDHVGPLLDAVIDEINQAKRELPERERRPSGGATTPPRRTAPSTRRTVSASRLTLIDESRDGSFSQSPA